MNAQKASSSSQGGADADVDLTVIAAPAEYAVGLLRNHVILIWRRKTLASGVTDVRRGFLEAVRGRPGVKLGFVTIVDAQCEMSAAPEVRDEVAELLRIYAAQVGAAAVTFEGTGFRMTLVRSVITAINLASRTRFPNAVFTEKVSAALWMEQQMQRTGLPVSAARIIDAVEYLRHQSAAAGHV